MKAPVVLPRIYEIFSLQFETDKSLIFKVQTKAIPALVKRDNENFPLDIKYIFNVIKATIIVALKYIFIIFVITNTDII